MNDSNDLVSSHILGPLTANSFGDKFLFNLNRHNFDKISSITLFETKFGETLFNENTLYVIVGTDSGLLLKYLQNKTVPKGSRYIFIEPESVLTALKEHGLLALDECSERVLCISLQDWSSAIRNFKIADYFYINAVRSFNAFCAQDDFINEYAELSWNIVETLAQLNWENNTAIGQEAFIDRQIKNIADNKLPAKLLQHAFSGQTVVILAGGPSLDDALPWVKSHRKQFVVFAVSRISRQLLAADIEPDFVFSVDPQDISFDISKEMFRFSERTVFICSYHASSKLLNQWQGLMLYLGARVPWESQLNVANLGGAGPTVTNAALNVAYDFGFKRIILAGVDLCFTRDGFTHAKGSNEQLVGPKLNLTSLQVETNGGFLAPTGNDYAQAIKTLSLQARRIVYSGGRVINGSLGAAKIEGVEYIPLAEIKIENTLIDARVIVDSKVSDYALKDDYLAKVLSELQRAEFQVDAIKRLAEQARQINGDMYNADGVLENYKDKRKLDQIEKKFKRQYRHFAKLVKRFGIRQFIQVVRPFNDDDWTFDEARKLGNIYYDAYLEGTKKLAKLIEEAIQRVVARQQEEQTAPDFDLLFAQWRKDQSFGRAKAWRIKHPNAEISAAAGSVFDEFEREFEEVLNQKDTRHLARIKSRSNLTIVRQRAGLLFKHKKSEELRDLLLSLDKHEQQQAAEPYRFLINGYLAELAGDAELALNAYHRIIDCGEMLLEDALIRIARMGIEHDNIQNVQLALDCLSKLNPVYLPFYAEIQRLQGNMLDAIDTYSDYVSQFPADTLAQIKLAMLYIECNSYEGAEMMLNFILSQKPDYEAAVVIKRQMLASRAMN